MDFLNKNDVQQLVLSESIYNDINKIIEDLYSNIHPEVIVFAESNGYPVTAKGNVTGIDLPSISTLAANNFSATAKMASMIGEKDSFRYLFHEGDKTNIYLSNVGFNFILLVIFDSSIALGMVRVYTKKAMQALIDLLKTAKQEEETSNEFIDLEFKTLLSEEINRALKI